MTSGKFSGRNLKFRHTSSLDKQRGTIKIFVLKADWKKAPVDRILIGLTGGSENFETPARP